MAPGCGASDDSNWRLCAFKAKLLGWMRQATSTGSVGAEYSRRTAEKMPVQSVGKRVQRIQDYTATDHYDRVTVVAKLTWSFEGQV